MSIKHPRINAVSGVIVIAVILFYLAIARWLSGRHSYATIEYQLDSAPNYLREDLAVEKSMKAITEILNSPMTTVMVAQGRTRSPEGVQDTFLLRNTLNPNIGVIQFRSRQLDDSGRYIEWIVNVTLQDNRLACQVVRAH